MADCAHAKVWNVNEKAAIANPQPGGTGLSDPDLLLAQRIPFKGMEAARLAAYTLQFPKHRFEVHGPFLCLMDDSKKTTTKEGNKNV